MKIPNYSNFLRRTRQTSPYTGKLYTGMSGMGIGCGGYDSNLVNPDGTRKYQATICRGGRNELKCKPSKQETERRKRANSDPRPKPNKGGFLDKVIDAFGF